MSLNAQKSSVKASRRNGSWERQQGTCEWLFVSTRNFSAHSCRILHELGALLAASQRDWTADIVPVQQMAHLIHLLLSGTITSNSAKKILNLVFDGNSSSIRDIASSENLLISEVDDQEYESIIARLLDKHTNVVTAIKKKGQKGKIMWLVGQVMTEMGKAGKGGSIRPDKVRRVLEKMLDE
jgi:aspartyl-tRNA(Asn)/glutamyl-tRNA(Gln) amidotransferase subunit B